MQNCKTHVTVRWRRRKLAPLDRQKGLDRLSKQGQLLTEAAKPRCGSKKVEEALDGFAIAVEELRSLQQCTMPAPRLG